MIQNNNINFSLSGFPFLSFFLPPVLWRPGGMPELVLEYILKQQGLEIGSDVEVINNIAFTSTSGAFASDLLWKKI